MSESERTLTKPTFLGENFGNWTIRQLKTEITRFQIGPANRRVNPSDLRSCNFGFELSDRPISEIPSPPPALGCKQVLPPVRKPWGPVETLQS
jgi:hypothetical protein